MATPDDPLNPAWPDVYVLAIDDPVAGGPDGVDNLPHQQLEVRTDYLRAEQATLAATVADHAGRLAAIEGDSSAVAGRAQRLVWGLGDSGYDCELFVADGYSWRDTPIVGGVVTVAGDDSVDCASTARLLVGGSYVVWAGATRATVTVAQILSTTRLRATAPLAVSLTGGQMGRTNWAVGTGFADAPVGGVLFSRALSAVRYYAEGRVVVRRDVGDAVLDVAWRGAGGSVWTAGARVETLELEAGTRDEVWAVGGGPMDIRVTVSAGPSGLGARVHSMVAYTAPKAGVADFVQRPVALSPVDGAENASETPTLTASVYRSLYGLPQAASRWQVSEDPAFGTLLHDHVGGAVANYQLPAGVLVTGRAYFWRGSYIDNDGNASPFSEPGAFSTGSTFEYVKKPAAVAPAAGATGAPPTPTLQSSAFAAVGGADTHAASRWRVGTSAAMTTLVHDSGVAAAHLTSYAVPAAAGLALLTTYWWQVQHVGTRIGAGEWSTPTSFTVQARPAIPHNLAPAAGAADVTLTPTLQSSGFAMLAGGADAHAASEWRVGTSAAMTTIIHHSGPSASLTSYLVPAASGLLPGVDCYWQVRHQGAASGWSEWSMATKFTCGAVGQALFIQPGVHQFVVPPEVTSLCVLVVGGGGQGIPDRTNDGAVGTSSAFAGILTGEGGKVGNIVGGSGLNGTGWGGDNRSAGGTYSSAGYLGYGAGSAASGGAGGGGGWAYDNDVSVVPGATYSLVVGQGGYMPTGAPAGQDGCVWVIWGPSRSFPNNMGA